MNHNAKTTFAVLFGNRGFFPAGLIEQARQDIPRLLREWGHDVLMPPADATRYGAVETSREGAVFADFLRENRGRYGGVILSLPNFGDETGAVAALQEAGVPIFIQAYPDDLAKMGPAHRRDAFCGKISVMDVFYQYGVRFSIQKPHVVDPLSPAFKANIDYFDRVCRVVNGVRGMVVGGIGARTTPFKTVRVDEVTLQRHGITVETLDLAGVLPRVNDVRENSDEYTQKAAALLASRSWAGVPPEAFARSVKLAVVLDWIIVEYGLDAVAIRCWLEMQEQLGISPCAIMGELNQRGIAAACEVDIANAVAMHALALAAGGPPACLDWNNNYADDDDKCILFHCGPVPPSLMAGPGCVTSHSILAGAIGESNGWGCNTGRIAPGAFTFGSLLTEQGRIKWFLGEGAFTQDPVPDDFFGCAGVAAIPRLQDVLHHIGRNGFRHHASVAFGHVQAPLHEALTRYLDFDVSLPQHA